MTSALSGTGLIAAGTVVTAAAVHAPGWVAFERGTITAVGGGRPPAPVDRDFGDAVIVPGFVDVHVHGGGGSGYTEGSAHLARRARAAHLAHGTTTSLASLVTDTPERMLAGVRMLAGLVAAGVLRGIHLEGPWLSPERAGAHDQALLRAPDPAEIDALLRAGSLAGQLADPHADQGAGRVAKPRPEAVAGGGAGSAPRNAIAMVTIAPELPGAIEAIERFVRAGVVVAIGHTDADYACVTRAIDAGATVATHLFNAMRPLHHREPGPVLALLQDQRVTVELIADGTHLHPALARWAAAQGGAAMLVTDAMGAAACGDGAYRLGSLDVDVTGGVARVAGSDTIAGSTATMDRLLRDWVEGAAADRDDALREAAQLTAVNPALAMGWDDVGDLAVGRRMDAVVLDRDLRVAEVIRGGREDDLSRCRDIPAALG